MGFKLLKGGTVITFNNTTQKVHVFREASVLIKDDRITAIAPNAEIETPDSAEIIDVHGKIISPGFINTHVHMWQSVFRTMGPNITLAQYFGGWLNQFAPTTAAAFKPEDVYISCLQGYMEGLSGGVTSYLDHAHNNWAPEMTRPGFNAAKDSGARVWWCYDVANRDNFPFERQWEALSDIASNIPASSLVQPGISLDSLSMSFRSDTDNHLQYTQQMIEKLNLRAITMHHLGGPWPTGNTSPAYICNQHLHNEEHPVVFSHAGYLTNEEQKSLRDHDIFISITPESEFHFGHGQTTGRLVSDQASLGLDTNWTFSGDMLSQARLWLQSVRRSNFEQTLDKEVLPRETPFTVEQGFLMATRQGGLALKRPDIGVLQVGAKADILVFNGDSPNMLGWSDPVAAVVLHANPADIEHVLVDGEFRKRDFKMLDVGCDWDKVKEEFLKAARRIQPLTATPPPMPEKVFGVGEMGSVETASTIKP